MSYHIFKRKWWRDNSSWPNGLEPWAGKKTTLDYADTETEARTFCRDWNNKNTPGKYSLKAEYEKE